MPKQGRAQPTILPTQSGSPNLPLARGGYFHISSRPWHILLFLLPFVAFYELGSTGIIGGGVSETLKAQDMLVRFFDLFGVLGLHLPAIALVLTLLIQHLLSKSKWTIHPRVLLAMVAESAFLTGPLVVIAIILSSLAPATMIQQPVPIADPDLTSSTFEGIYLAFGAGIYEEMLFRLVLITLLHFVVADVLGFKHKTGLIVAVLLSALAFAWHHDAVTSSGAINWRLAVFYTIAGAYFGVLFIARGFGIAVGAHLMYDILVLVVMPGIQAE
jgi:membrane protease YdiL (CAAX protease family)